MSNDTQFEAIFTADVVTSFLRARLLARVLAGAICLLLGVAIFDGSPACFLCALYDAYVMTVVVRAALTALDDAITKGITRQISIEQRLAQLARNAGVQALREQRREPFDPYALTMMEARMKT